MYLQLNVTYFKEPKTSSPKNLKDLGEAPQLTGAARGPATSAVETLSLGEYFGGRGWFNSCPTVLNHLICSEF